MIICPFLVLWVSCTVTILAPVDLTPAIRLSFFPVTTPAAFAENILMVLLGLETLNFSLFLFLGGLFMTCFCFGWFS
jgi:hypothetical protein